MWVAHREHRATDSVSNPQKMFNLAQHNLFPFLTQKAGGSHFRLLCWCWQWFGLGLMTNSKTTSALEPGLEGDPPVGTV